MWSPVWCSSSRLPCASVSSELCQSTQTEFVSLHKALRDPWMIPFYTYKEGLNDSGGCPSSLLKHFDTFVKCSVFSMFSSCVSRLDGQQNLWSLISTWLLLFDRIYCLCEKVLSRIGWRTFRLPKLHWGSIKLWVSEGFLWPVMGSWLQTGELEAWEKHEYKIGPGL